MKKVYGVLSIAGLVVAIVFAVVLFVADYQINRDIVGWQTRAQVSSEPHDMHDYMVNVKAGVEQWDMTTGYAFPLMPTPENDMTLVYRTLQQHIDQAEVLTGMDRSTPEYQTGLDNLRGSIRELDLHAFEYYSWHSGLVWWVLCVLGCLVFAGFGWAWEVAY